MDWTKVLKDMRSALFVMPYNIIQEGNAQMSHKKAVIIDMMKSVGEIASKIWPVVYYLIHFWENLTLTFDLDQRSKHKRNR